MSSIVIYKLVIPVFSLLMFFTYEMQNSFNKNVVIVFFGDSITELGNEPGGYVTIIRDSLNEKYKDFKIQVIGAGISGNKVPDLQARIDKDVLSKNPTKVVIYIGINDVWHYDLDIGGTPKDKFENGLIKIINKIKTKNAEVILCTPSVIGERFDGTNKHDKMLDEYSDITRKIAKEKNIPLCDLRKTFIEHETIHNPKNLPEGILTNDGVHLNEIGNRLVAFEILKLLK